VNLKKVQLGTQALAGFTGSTCNIVDLAETSLPSIALHGLMGSGACLLPLARALADHDIILPDARGHGGSSSPPNGFLYSDLAGDVIGLIGNWT
jgi:pimeloyl-ACP methyl ester carboxylesterase